MKLSRFLLLPPFHTPHFEKLHPCSSSYGDLGFIGYTPILIVVYMQHMLSNIKLVLYHRAQEHNEDLLLIEREHNKELHNIAERLGGALLSIASKLEHSLI